jgi:acyl-ACP thioesterase
MQPRWADLDINQHVNNVKYIAWILEVIFFLIICVFILAVNVSCLGI